MTLEMTSAELERRLKRIYRDVQITAEQRLRKAQRRFNQFLVMPDVPLQYQEAAARMWLMRIDYEQRIIQGMANDIARAGDTATRMIDSASMSWFTNGYNATMSRISRELDLFLPSYNRSVLTAIFNGENTPLGRLQGFQGSFEQVGHRQVWQSMASDRRRGRYYFDRASQRLGHDPMIVGRLRDSLTQSILLGESIPQMAKRIGQVIESCRLQAVRISRTEAMRAGAQGRMLGMYHAEELGIPMKKRWLSTNDERTRPQQGGEFDHLSANGQTVAVNEPFIVSGEPLQYPLDPNGSAGNTIQCRCQLVSVVTMNKTSKAYDELVERVTNR